MKNRKFSFGYFKSRFFLDVLLFVIIINIPFILDVIKHNSSRFYIALFISLAAPFVAIIAFNLKPVKFAVISFFILIVSIIYDVQFLEYRNYVNISTWSTILDSYIDEAQEFAKGMNTNTFLLILFQIVAYIFFFTRSLRSALPDFSKRAKRIAALLLLLLVVDFVFKGASRKSFPFRGLYGLGNYIVTKYQEKNILETKKAYNYETSRLPEFDQNQKETIIIVIGESLRRDHLEYYGYPLPTTPLIKNENIIAYTDVVSAANQTINALKRVFTPVEHLDEKDYWNKPSFITLFKDVGFKTFWITNQYVYGRHESQASFIARETDKFISNRPSNYDEILIPELKKVLQDTAQKKLIFLHLMGNHAGYSHRHPKTFNFFHPEKAVDKKEKMIRSYDNAVRYNDYILHKVLQLLKQQKGESTFIMFSDHAESLYDAYPDYAYHGTEKPSKTEVEIPLIIWFSDTFKKHHPHIVQQVIKNKNLPVISYDFFHAIPGLFGIRFIDYKAENDFFGPSYIPKTKRKIINVNLELLNYDDLK